MSDEMKGSTESNPKSRFPYWNVDAPGAWNDFSVLRAPMPKETPKNTYIFIKNKFFLDDEERRQSNDRYEGPDIVDWAREVWV